MNEEAEFLQALQLNPNDDSFRLLYADWLDERGDARGQFLRLEATFAELSRQDPHGSNPHLRSQRSSIEARLQELQSGFEMDWLASVARVVRFHCGRCNLPVTQPLRRFLDSGEIAAIASAWKRDRRAGELVPKGYYWVATAGHPLSELIAAGHYCVNLRDLVNTRHHPDPTRLRGCCGLGGPEENTVCVCGREIGIECTDCYFPCHYFEMKHPFGFIILEAEGIQVNQPVQVE